MISRALSGVLLTAGLAACAGNAPGLPAAGESHAHGLDATVADGRGREVVPLPAKAVVQGALVYREPVILPPEALARVQLVRLGPDRTPRGVLATTWVAGPMVPPVPFRLTWNPRRALPLQPDERLAVVAMVILAEEVLFTSVAPAALVSTGEPVVVPLLARWGGLEV